jgi:hypothetical protein
MWRALALPRPTSLLLVCLAAWLGVARLQATGVFDPALHFETLTTAHFVVYFHQGEAATAARLATVAEDTWQQMRQQPGVTPPSRTHVVLVDQSETANGWASPLPYDTVVITAAWPKGSEYLGRTDDWLRLAFAHEFAHIVHLDRSESWARIVRRMFGRAPLAFPNLFLPIWQIEGLAVYEESLVSGDGRLHAGDFRAIEREAGRAHAVPPLDRVNGGLIAWPGGLTPYAYGLGFHAYLADRYGSETLATLADADARRVPYFAAPAFRKIYGKPLGALWRDYRDSLVSGASAPREDEGVKRLTHHGFLVSGPRFAPPRCSGCPLDIVYSTRDPNAFPSLNAVAADGSRARRLATRYLGSTSGVGAESIVFDQQELRRNVGLYSDLFVLDRATGRVRALTSEARLMDPDLSPDGRTIVCVREGRGQRDLVSIGLPGGSRERLKLDALTTLVSEPGTQFDTPRWSPDGRSIAVARHRAGAPSELVVVDVDSRRVRVVAADETGRIVTPAWTPEGRTIVAAADFGEATFNLYEFAADASRPPRPLTNTSGGATWPDISPDGRTIVFVGYTVDGFDLFTLPFPQADARSATELAPKRPELRAGSAAPRETAAASPAVGAPYSPWATVKPTSWMPVVERSAHQVRAGFATSGQDVLGRHAYSLAATWQVADAARIRSGGPASALHRATPDWQVAYAYERWRPTFFLSASSTTSFFAGPPAADGTPSDSTRRSRQIEAALLVPMTHVRVASRALAAVLRSVDAYTFATGPTSVNRTSLRAGWATSSAHTYGYSVGPEGGISAGATAEWTRRALGAFADARTFTADLRGYLPGLAPHQVVAIRAGAGASDGTAIMRRTFLLGGPLSADTLDFGSEAFSLLRGFPSDTFAGSHVAVASVEYRAALMRPERGVGTWPLFFQTVHGAVFADAGHAWTRAFRLADTKRSAGLELSADMVAGYTFPLTTTVGVGWGHDGAGRVRDGRTWYVRLGRSF